MTPPSLRQEQIPMKEQCGPGAAPLGPIGSAGPVLHRDIAGVDNLKASRDGGGEREDDPKTNRDGCIGDSCRHFAATMGWSHIGLRNDSSCVMEILPISCRSHAVTLGGRNNARESTIRSFMDRNFPKSTFRDAFRISIPGIPPPSPRCSTMSSVTRRLVTSCGRESRRK